MWYLLHIHVIFGIRIRLLSTVTDSQIKHDRYSGKSGKEAIYLVKEAQSKFDSDVFAALLKLRSQKKSMGGMDFIY